MTTAPATNPVKAAFLDIGGTIGDPVFSDPPVRLVGIDVYAGVPEAIGTLHATGIRLGIISNSGDVPGAAVDDALRGAGLLDLFEDGLRLYSSEVGMDKGSPAIFRMAADRAGFGDHPELCLFVGEDARERAHATAAGLQVAASIATG